MSAQQELYEAAIKILADLPPYEQCREIVQMVYDGSLTHEQALRLLHLLVEHEMDAAEPGSHDPGVTRSVVAR